MDSSFSENIKNIKSTEDLLKINDDVSNISKKIIKGDTSDFNKSENFTNALFSIAVSLTVLLGHMVKAIKEGEEKARLQMDTSSIQEGGLLNLGSKSKSKSKSDVMDEQSKAIMKALNEAMNATNIAKSTLESFEKKNIQKQDEEEDRGGDFIMTSIGIIKNVMATLLKMGIKQGDKMVATAIDSVTAGNLNVPISELPSETKIRVVNLAAFLKLMAEDPEFVDALKDLTRVAGSAGTNMIEVGKPYIIKIVRKMSDTAEQVVSEATTGAMRSLISFATSVISAIPVFGGFFNLFITAGITFNTITNVIKKFTQGNAKAIDIATTGMKRTLDANIDKISETRRALQRVFNPRKKESYSSLEPSAPPFEDDDQTGGGFYKQFGGKKTRVLRAKKRIYKTTQRLNKTLKRFSGGGRLIKTIQN